MKTYWFLFISLWLAALCLTVSVEIQAAPNSPDPEVVVSLATDYDIAPPRLYYVYDPGCAPIQASVTPDTVGANVTQYIARTAIHGATPRRLYEFTYDEFCGTSQPDIYSNVDGDNTHIYWVSRTRGGLVRLHVDSLLGDEPELFSPYDFDVDLSDIVVTDSHIYILEGISGDGLFQVEKATGTVNRLLGVGSLGVTPTDLQSDDLYLYWRSSSGATWNLRRYKLADGTQRILATGVRSYRPDPMISGIGVYIGMHNELRIYINLTETLGAPLFTSAVEADITSVNADSANIYFLEQPTGTGAFTVYRRSNATRTSTPIYTSSPTPVWQVLHDLHVEGEYLYFLRNDELLRMRIDEDSVTLTNLRATDLKVVQAIQSDDHTVPLIQGKRTAVRLLAKSDGGTVAGVTAHLYRLNATGAVIDGPLSPNNRILDASGWRESPYLSILSTPDPDNLAESFTFFLPPDWIDDATLRVRADLNPFHFPHEPEYGDNIITGETLNMQPSPRLATEVVLFEYEVCAGGTCTRYAPRYLEDFLQAVSWIRRAYPLASAPGWSDDPTPGFRPNWRVVFDAGLDERVMQTHPSCSSNLCASGYTNGILSTLRIAEGLPDSIFMYGMISDGAAFPRGQADGHVSSGPAGSTRWAWDTDGSYADWYMAHEVGHSLGRKHPTPGSAICDHSASDNSYPYVDGLIGDDTLHGFDVGNPNLNPALVPRIYPSDSWYDVMTYCDYQWISDYTYEGILDYLATVGSSEVVPSTANGPHLQLNGIIMPPGDTVVMTHVRIWPSPAHVPNPPKQGSHRVRIVDGNGSELALYDFTPLLIEDGEGALAIDLLLPLAEGAVRVELQSKTPPRLLWQYTISANAPAVSDVQVTVQPKTNTASVQWNANDADGDPLSFDILYSADDGKTWQTVKLGVSGVQVVVDTAMLAGSQNGRFKVLATDGVNQGEAISPKVVIVDKPPLVMVLTPVNGTRVAYGQLVEFVAEVFDFQDGSIPAKNIVWRDQSGTILGVGTAFATDALRIGVNQITVRATNSRALSNSQSVTVIVVDDLALPGPSLAVAPTQVGWHITDGTTAKQTATLFVGNAGSGELTVSFKEDAPWLSINALGGKTPFSLLLTADAVGMSPGESYSTVLEVTGTASPNEQKIDVPISISMGSPYQQDAEKQFPIYLPMIMR